MVAITKESEDSNLFDELFFDDDTGYAESDMALNIKLFNVTFKQSFGPWNANQFVKYIEFNFFRGVANEYQNQEQEDSEDSELPRIPIASIKFKLVAIS